MSKRYDISDIAADFRTVFRGAAGDRVLDVLGKHCFADRDTFAPDPYAASFRQGQREVFLWIKRTMEIEPGGRPAVAITESEGAEKQ